MRDPIADDGVPLDLGVQLGIGRLLQKPLRLLQCDAQPHAQAQQSVPGRIAPSGKHLVQVDLAHAGLSGQGRLGDILLLIERCQQFRNTLLREKRSVLIHIGVKTWLVHQFILQIIGGFVLHAILLLDFQFDFQFQIIYT